jgi:hypothetical protein
MINLTEIVTQAFVNLISGLITNIVWLLVLIWGVKTISGKIGLLIKNIPSYISQYDDMKMKHYKIGKALEK